MESLNTLTACQVAEVELIYKSKVNRSLLPTITCPHDAYAIFVESWDKNKIDYVEEFKVMMLNRANKVLCIYPLATGGTTCVTVDTKLIFTAALKSGAAIIILAHNHPSGQLTASAADKQLTAKVVQAGKFLDIPVADHIIVTSEGYYSFARGGDL